MIYVLTIRNKSGLPVTYQNTAMSKLVFEFAAPDADVAMDAIREVLREVRSMDAYMVRAIEEAVDDSWDSSYKRVYNLSQSGLQIDWKEVDGVN